MCLNFMYYKVVCELKIYNFIINTFKETHKFSALYNMHSICAVNL